MYKSLIFSVFFAITCLFSQVGFAGNSFSDFSARSGRGGEARRGKSGISGRAKASKTRIRSGVNNFKSTTSATGQTDSSSFKDNPPDTPYSNTQCLNTMKKCLSAKNICGNGLFGCFDMGFTDGVEPDPIVSGEIYLNTSSQGLMCKDVIEKCQCHFSSNCDAVWDQLLLLIQNSQYDAGKCQKKFMSCAKKECGGDNYRGCVDLIDTVINDGASDDRIDSKKFLRGWLDVEEYMHSNLDGSGFNFRVLSHNLQTQLMQRLASCEENVLKRCDGYAEIKYPVNNEVIDFSRVLLHFFHDFARKAEDGLIAYQETHAKTKWLNAEECVDTVDVCMAPHCGNGYEKCLHEDGTVDAVSATNFKSYCQKDLIGCSEIRVEVGLPGYQFLQNPGVDGVEAVWNEWLSKKLLAHGNTFATAQREKERKHDKLVAKAQRECDLAGGTFAYEQTLLQNYAQKFGADADTDDYKGDGGIISQNLGQDADQDGIPDTFGITDTTGNNNGLKSERFYDRATCNFTIVLKRASGMFNRSAKHLNFVGNPQEISFRQIGVKCDEALFPEALNTEKQNKTGAVLGAVGGGLLGVLAGKSIGGADKEKRNSLIGGGIGAVGGVAGGIALQKQMLKKKISCAMETTDKDSNGEPEAGTEKYIPVAKFGQIITLPQQQKLKSAFDALDASEVFIQRGEYYNTP